MRRTAADDYLRHYYGDEFFAAASADALTSADQCVSDVQRLTDAGSRISSCIRARPIRARSGSWRKRGTVQAPSPSLEEEIMGGQHEGGCACGAVRYRLTSEPLFTHCCHCLSCQRQTGSAFVINLLIEADRVELLAGVPRPVEVPRDDGSTQRIFRCPACQVAVFSEYGFPAVRFVRAGTLDRPSDVTPDVHIYTRSKLGWITLPDSAPAFEVYYDRESLWPAASLERLEAIMASVSPDA